MDFFSFSRLFIKLIFFCHIRLSTPEPVVTWQFYRSTVFKIGVKEYLNIDSTVNTTVGCDLSNFSPLYSGMIKLSSGNTTLMESSLLKRSLLWTGIISNHSNLSCSALLHTQTNVKGDINSQTFTITSTVLVTTLDFQIPSDRDGICLPRKDGQKFMKNEAVPIICSSDGVRPKWVSNAELLTNQEWFFKGPSNQKVIQSFVRMSEQLFDKKANCTRHNDDASILCTIQLASLQSEYDMIEINIDPVTIPIDVSLTPLRFTCHTNVPTERINWRVEAALGDILALGNQVTPIWNFSISHHRSSSELTLPAKINRLVAVSCWTNRAGFFAQAVASNRSGTQEISMKQPETLSATSHYYMILTVTLAVTCVTLLFAIIFILRRKSRLSQRGSEVVGYVVSEPTSSQNIQPSLYTSIPELNSPDGEMKGSRQDIRSKKTRRSTDELSISILEEESEDCIYNAIYDSIE